MNPITKTKILFSKSYENFGEIQIRAFDLKNDHKTIHSWVNKPYARYWGMQEFTVEQVEQEYRKIENNEHHHVCMGTLNHVPIFLIEYYDPNQDSIADHYKVLTGDVGMHILVAPVEKKVSKFTWKVFATTMDFLFKNPEVKRIVVEPDVANEKIHVLNTKAGFVYQKEIQLSHKKAHLAICTRKDYEDAIQNQNSH
ncbi:GNAT family N-acetyltransferase [Aquimarina sp. AU474]|uniref:GNAT family N-acetyltransferase n=1 Tax=Aquimarina sp. AU474 TaxID=2108529 RepID=UPI00190F62E4|nr:GNAT family N-acetyltransferase [Aquimarina sp. AU474]